MADKDERIFPIKKKIKKKKTRECCRCGQKNQKKKKKKEKKCALLVIKEWPIKLKAFFP